MAFTKLNYEKDWTRAADFPAYESDEAKVRADLQYHPDAVKDYINNTLLNALASKDAAAELGAAEDGTKTTIQSVLDRYGERLAQLGEDIETVAAGGVPSVAQSTAVTFSKDGWATVSGSITLTIPKNEHMRENANFGFNLYQLVDGGYRSGTWGSAATRVSYNSGGSITLTADEAYSGKIVFFGL